MLKRYIKYVLLELLEELPEDLKHKLRQIIRGI